MTPEQQEGYRLLIETRGALGGPNKVWVHNPKLAKVMGPLGAYFRTGYSLSEREREIAVVIINSKWHSIYPTNAHERAGKAAGLPADRVEAMLSGLPTSFDNKREQVVYEMATCLANSRWAGITDVICLMGFYTSVSVMATSVWATLSKLAFRSTSSEKPLKRGAILICKGREANPICRL